MFGVDCRRGLTGLVPVQTSGIFVDTTPVADSYVGKGLCPLGRVLLQ